MPSDKTPKLEYSQKYVADEAKEHTINYPNDNTFKEERAKFAKKTIQEEKTTGHKFLAKLDVAEEKAESKENYNVFIKEAREIISKYGIDRIVIHGNPITDERIDLWENKHLNNEGKPLVPEKYKLKDAPAVDIKPDLDVRGALYLLDKIQEVKPEIYNDGIFIESVPKGDEVTYEPKREKREVIFILDTGNTNPRIDYSQAGKILIYADHHGEKGDHQTSATKIVHDIFESIIMHNEKLAKEAKELKKLSTFITKFDNFQFLDDIHKGKERTKVFDSDYFIKKFPRSLYNLAKVLPFETTLEIIADPSKFKLDGKARSWLEAFSKEEIENGDFGKIEVSIQDPNDRTKQIKLTIKEYVTGDYKENIMATKGVENCEKYMLENGINPESPITGKTLWHDFPEIEITEKGGKKRKTINTIKQNKAYLAAKAKGYDAIVFDNPRTGGLFTNADGKHNLRRVWGKLNKRIPGYPEPIRNIFMFEPKDPKMLGELKKISQEERLEMYGMKTEKYVAIKKERIEEIKSAKEAYAKEEEELKKQLEILMQEAGKQTN